MIPPSMRAAIAIPEMMRERRIGYWTTLNPGLLLQPPAPVLLVVQESEMFQQDAEAPVVSICNTFEPHGVFTLLMHVTPLSDVQAEAKLTASRPLFGLVSVDAMGW